MRNFGWTRFAFTRPFRALGSNENVPQLHDKIAAMEEFFAEYGIDPTTTIYMGDDIPDLECMERVGIPVCPADACSEVIEASRYVSEFCGGKGAVRDIIEQTLRAQDEWAKDRRGVLGIASK